MCCKESFRASNITHLFVQLTRDGEPHLPRRPEDKAENEGNDRCTRLMRAQRNGSNPGTASQRPPILKGEKPVDLPVQQGKVKRHATI
jgi:hypothetical protein